MLLCSALLLCTVCGRALFDRSLAWFLVGLWLLLLLADGKWLDSGGIESFHLEPPGAYLALGASEVIVPELLPACRGWSGTVLHRVLSPSFEPAAHLSTDPLYDVCLPGRPLLPAQLFSPRLRATCSRIRPPPRGSSTAHRAAKVTWACWRAAIGGRVAHNGKAVGGWRETVYVRSTVFRSIKIACNGALETTGGSGKVLGDFGSPFGNPFFN